jgi:hypothetical protein
MKAETASERGLPSCFTSEIVVGHAVGLVLVKSSSGLEVL